MDDSNPVKTEASKSKGRGVSYPVMALEEALEKARAFHREERKSAAPVSSAIRHFGYSETSSGGRQVVSTLLQFGLLEDEGRSENRQVKLTDRALTILLDEPNSPDRLAALKEVATMPKLYSQILAKYPGDLPSDHTIGFYLQKEFDFNPKTLKDFIRDFRTTLAFANVMGEGTIPPASEARSSDELPPIAAYAQPAKVGDLIQWDAGGVLRFDAPRRVRALKEFSGTWWVFVDGSETGIPMTEAVIQERKAMDITPQAAPTLALEPSVLVPSPALAAGQGEREWLRGPLSREASYRLVVSGDMGAKEIGKLIKLLEAQKLVLDDDE